MNARSRSITRSLIVRMALACLVLTALVGTGTYLLERQRIQAAVEERAMLGIELLRARVRQLATSTGEPWQGVVPRALAQPDSSAGVASVMGIGFCCAPTGAAARTAPRTTAVATHRRESRSHGRCRGMFSLLRPADR